MALTRKQHRSILIGTGLGILALAVGLVLWALEDTLVFFYTPAQAIERGVSPGERFRLGGMVAEGSVDKSEGTIVRFTVEDVEHQMPVEFAGVLPDLFREGQGVVAEGMLNASGVFEADTVLAKHDENYMPREVADALREQGLWQHGEEQPEAE
jgi:cytochrome c-type biogenesis protein CcmE